jgi:predicted RNA-binding Zn-ribbon protein involved in translation (DUF1610 family)
MFKEGAQFTAAHNRLLFELTFKEKKMSAQKIEYCTSCGIRLVEGGYVKFPCPECGSEIGRCASCRQQGNVYTCPKCGFKAP